MKKITLQYYANLREERGVAHEIIETNAETLEQLYKELRQKYQFKLTVDSLKVAVNEEFSNWKSSFKEGDIIVFIPPVSGG